MYDGFPVDVAAYRDHCGCVDITGQRLLESNEPGHGCHLRQTVAWPKPEEREADKPQTMEEAEARMWHPPDFTEADLMRLAGQLERAEAQGYRFERYARCGVGEHRHRWEIVSKLCQIWTYIRRLKWQ